MKEVTVPPIATRSVPPTPQVCLLLSPASNEQRKDNRKYNDNKYFTRS